MDNTYDLVFPFVLAEDQGGPWPGEAVVTAYRLGRITMMLEFQRGHGFFATVTDPQPWDTDDPHWPLVFRQIELIAMNYGYIVIPSSDDEGRWVYLHYNKTPPSDEPSTS